MKEIGKIIGYGVIKSRFYVAGQPGDITSGNGTDCVAIFTQSALWDDVDCNVRNGYICEKTGKLKTGKKSYDNLISKISNIQVSQGSRGTWQRQYATHPNNDSNDTANY